MVRTCICLVGLAVGLAAADKPNKDIQELHRDVANLEETLRKFQRAFEERMAAQDKQMQGATDAAAKAVAAAAQVQVSVERLAKDLEVKLAPLASLGGRVDQLSGNAGTTQQSVADLTAVVNKLVTQVGDLTLAVKASQTKVEAPGPPASATDMFTNADRDLMSSKHELALQEFEEYLKWYGDSPQADRAWYAIGSIHYTLKDNAKALQAFDTVLAKYPASTKTPEALFYKAKALDAMNRVKESVEVRAELRRRFPKNPLATQR
jgi:TolA-binding protein